MRVLVFLLAISLRIGAQVSDSLLANILLVKNDTERVNRLYSRGFSLRHSNPQLAYRYARLCQEAAESRHSDLHLAKSYNLLGVLYYKKGDYKTAQSYHLRALKLRTECRDELGIAFSNTNLGNIYADLHLYDKAEAAYLKAIEIHKKWNNTDKLIGCLINLGALKHLLKKYDAAQENYLLAFNLSDDSDYDTRAMCLTNLGEASLGIQQLDKALAYNEDALKLRKLSDNKVETSDNYLNIGSVYLAMGQAPQAKFFIDTAWTIACRNDYFELRHEAEKVYASYYNGMKDYEKAYTWLKKYYDTNDSLLLAQNTENNLYNFNEQEEKEEIRSGSKSFADWWQITAIAAIFVLLPFYLIRFKR